MGIANPTFAEVRALYIYGPSGGMDLARAIDAGKLDRPMEDVVHGGTNLLRNGTPPDVKVRDFLVYLERGLSGLGKNVMNTPIFMKEK